MCYFVTAEAVIEHLQASELNLELRLAEAKAGIKAGTYLPIDAMKAIHEQVRIRQILREYQALCHVEGCKGVDIAVANCCYRNDRVLTAVFHPEETDITIRDLQVALRTERWDHDALRSDVVRLLAENAMQAEEIMHLRATIGGNK